ncbi:MAG TPA: hypothetical protein VEZ16_01320 [Microvirga sp.]|nr:hypothetical protein [Microvirga sp.]
MELSVGDKVRVQFYPPKTTQSFVEGIVERNDITTYQGRCFSLKTTREVVLGHEIETPRSLPYIIAYAKEDDFEGRIEVLEPAAPPAAEPAEAAPEPEASCPAPTEPEENAGEPGFLLDVEVEADAEPEPRLRGWRRLFSRAA